MSDEKLPTPEPDDVDEDEYAGDVEGDTEATDLDPDDPTIVPPDEVDQPDPAITESKGQVEA